MSVRTLGSSKKLGTLEFQRLNMNDQTGNQKIDNDEDSVLELGQIALLGSSKASLRYRSISEINASRISNLNRREPSQKIPPDQSQSKQEELIEEFYTQETNPTFKPFIEHFLIFRGYYFGILSAFAFSLSQILMRRAKFLAGSDHSLVRYIITFIVMATTLKYKGLPIIPAKHLKLLLFRGFIGSCALISMYFALMFLNPADAVSLAHSSLIITAVLSRFFLKERLTIAHLIAFIFTIFGVIFISKPSIIFERNPEQKQYDVLKSRNSFNHTLELSSNRSGRSNLSSIEIMVEAYDDSTRTHTIVGICLTFFGAFSSACVFLVLKKLNNSKVHWATNTIFVCWFGVPFSIVLSIILFNFGKAHKNIQEELVHLPMDLFYSVLASMLSISGQVFLNISLKYEDATKIAITKTVDVFFSFILQFILLGIEADYLSVLGAISILTATFSVLMYRMIEAKYSTNDEIDTAINDDDDTKVPEKELETKPKENTIKRCFFKFLFMKF
jgi:drug/metabolite transporter (DMT)-like permease